MFEPERINGAAFEYYDRLGRVRDFVQRNYTRKISLRSAARVAGLEDKYFSFFFRSKTGVCFRDWLAWERTKHAMELIRSRNHSITRVAFSVGYQDLRTFERSFKRCTGQTPKAYKEKHRPC